MPSAGDVLTVDTDTTKTKWATPGAGGITQLTADVTAGPGSGSVAATVVATHLASPLPIAQGGTAGTTATTALTNLLPSQTGQSGNVLESNGTTASWQAPSAGGITQLTADVTAGPG